MRLPAVIVIIQFLLLTGIDEGRLRAQTREQAASRTATTVLSDVKSENVDARLLRTIYAWDSPVVTNMLGGVDASAYPGFVLAPASLWVLTAIDELDSRDAMAGSGSWLLAFGAAIVIKRTVGRERPYVARRNISPKVGFVGTQSLSESASFPSGHAALAGAIATGASILAPHPAVIATSTLWAAGVALSRIWLGVHYPSDVMAGLAVGATSAVVGFTVLH